MTTYREAIYMCLDLLKGMSDDFTYTEDHVAYLLDKFRALLLKQRYGNDPKKHVPYSNYQNVEVTFNNTTEYKKIIKSDKTIPNMLQLGIPRITTPDEYYYNYRFELTSRERLPSTGNNKFTSMINYCAINEDNHILYATKENQWSEDGKVNPNSFIITAIFENPREVESMDLDSNIPLEETLITTLIELVVKELATSVYRPNDDINDSRDDNAALATFIEKNVKSALAKQLEK